MAMTEDMDRQQLRLACRLCPRDSDSSREERNHFQGVTSHLCSIGEQRYVDSLGTSVHSNLTIIYQTRHMTDMGHGNANFIKFE